MKFCECNGLLEYQQGFNFYKCTSCNKSYSPKSPDIREDATIATEKPMPDKIVGEPCPVCQTPYIQGPRGVYCKPCFIKWKNSANQAQNASTGQNKPQNSDVDWDSVNKKKEEHMEWLNAKNNACLLAAHGKITLEELETYIQRIAAIKQPKPPVQVDTQGIDVGSIPFN